MKPDNIIAYALEEGFAAAEIVDTDQIIFDPSFRPYCEENLCGQYGANYSCPPSCGSPEAMKQKVLAHKMHWCCKPFGRSQTIRTCPQSSRRKRLITKRRSDWSNACGHRGLTGLLWEPAAAHYAAPVHKCLAGHANFRNISIPACLPTVSL